MGALATGGEGDDGDGDGIHAFVVGSGCEDVVSVDRCCAVFINLSVVALSRCISPNVVQISKQ